MELRASGIPPIANRVVMLTQQLEELREFEAGLVVVGNVLEKVIGTQTKLVQVRAPCSVGWPSFKVLHCPKTIVY